MNAIDMDEHNVTKRRLERNLLYPLPTSEVNANDKMTLIIRVGNEYSE